jgi:hypothetical protein
MEGILHILLPLIAFVGAVYMERYKAKVWSVIAFWDRHAQLEGTFVSIWKLAAQGEPSTAPAVTSVPIEDFVEIEWAAGGYVSGHGVNSRYGKYAISGEYTGQALTLTYRGTEKALRSHIGVIYLQVLDENTLAGTWAQSRPDLRLNEGGTVRWRRRFHDGAAERDGT